MKHAKHSKALKPTLGSVNGDVVSSRFSSCYITHPFHLYMDHLISLPPPQSMQFCKSTTVMTVVLTHYIELNTMRTISCSIKTDNSCFVQIYCIATYKITTTKEDLKLRISLLLQNIMDVGSTMFTVPIRSQTNPIHTST
jgi:hypothetical protein